MADEAQEQLGQHKYRVLMELGEGGTAHVFLAVARGPSGFNKLVVLKALKRSLAGDKDFRRMFMNEARLSARLNHPNIVQVNEVIEQEGLPVIVMQYLEGRSTSRRYQPSQRYAYAGHALADHLRFTVGTALFA